MKFSFSALFDRPATARPCPQFLLQIEKIDNATEIVSSPTINCAILHVL